MHARTIIDDIEFKRRLDSDEFAQAINEHIKNRDMIKITCWTGRVLFQGSYKDPKVDAVLDANRCKCADVESCEFCNSTGYNGDFEVNWVNENDKRNVYEFINY